VIPLDRVDPSPYHTPMLDQNDNPQPPLDPLTVGELISLQEAAVYAGFTKGSLNDYVRRGRLRAKKIGSQWVTTLAAVDEYLASRDFESIPKKYRKTSS